MVMYGRMGTLKMILIFPVQVNEISGVAQAGNVIMLCRASKEKEETIIISSYV